jgi:hypothetical protein
MDNGEIKSMDIVAYADNTFQTATGDKYTATVNPGNFSLKYGSLFNQQNAQGASESVGSFNRRLPQSLSFKFIFDASGVVPNTTAGDISAEFGLFKSVVYNYNSDMHQPRYVQLRYGVLIYNCIMTSMTVNFTLFKPSGAPIRAEVDCDFQGFIDDKKLAAVENRMSPDLTHIKTAMAGDTFPLVCYREYGDSKYYYQVAKYMAAEYSTMIDFKQLTPGAKIVLPHLTGS